MEADMRVNSRTERSTVKVREVTLMELLTKGSFSKAKSMDMEKPNTKGLANGTKVSGI